ncbi:hypothetical protein Nepgr_001255 [Nepenthes gracilis]|uniref:Uncharacterized protein n=1 Tax=Nepenthes gracilis TaxID=150966 RepID=A0AAD3P4H9_NEPGR|nr:hypothetical protein Nepgr_001255 [Nepenthes gracilis]
MRKAEKISGVLLRKVVRDLPRASNGSSERSPESLGGKLREISGELLREAVRDLWIAYEGSCERSPKMI